MASSETQATDSAPSSPCELLLFSLWYSQKANAMSDQYAFGAYRLDAKSRTLFRGADVVALSTKAAELLVNLAQSAGQVWSSQLFVDRSSI